MNDLLERIAQILSCPYLSDLHWIVSSRRQAEKLRELKEESYTLDQWQAAAQYILGGCVQASTVQACKGLIIAGLSKSRPVKVGS